MKHLITGIQGFAGSHLAERLLASGETVCGVARQAGEGHNRLPAGIDVRVFSCDVTRRADVEAVLAEVRPDRVYHLAALTFVPDVEQNLRRAWETHFLGTFHLLESLKKLKIPARVLWVGSGEEYGRIAEADCPVTEDHPLRPVSLYGVGKAAAEMLAASYGPRENLDILRVRPFNHIGPRQDGRFVCSAFARQIADIETGAEPVLRTGNLDVYRDFTDVRDTVRAYEALMQHGQSGEVYNVCSGRAVKIRTVLEQLLKETEISVRIEPEAARYREEFPVRIRGDARRLSSATGWKPEIPLEQTLHDLLHYWRQQRRLPPARGGR